MSTNQVDYGIVIPTVAYSVERAAAAMGVTGDQLRTELINKGEIEVCPIGAKGKYLILGRVIIDWVERNSKCVVPKSK